MGMAKLQRRAKFFCIVLCAVVFGAVTILTVKNSSEMQTILEDSVKAQLISISLAARELIDPTKLESYNSPEDINNDAESYQSTLEQLQSLQSKVGARYILHLKKSE
ncbi:MAG: hypothetical protein LBP55_00005 [Candidatus Adiutrix sp.]|jgi:hypothetical protein|nr:hypothetical protein [Candidatus Adiutrix sp.]